MENLSPCLQVALIVRFALERGESIKLPLISFLEQNDSKVIWFEQLKKLIICSNLGQSPKSILDQEKGAYRKAIMQLVLSGLKGESIYNQICLLEDEIVQASMLELERYHLTLPIKTLVPLVLFQFPAFLMILLGPILVTFHQL